MSFVYNQAKLEALTAGVDYVNDDLRVALVMTNTTADTEDDTDFMDQFTTLDEYDGANYARQAIANQAAALDLPNDRAEFDGDDVVFSNLGVGVRQAQGAILFKFVTNDADSVPIGFIDTGGFPFDGNGGDVTVQWNAEGILQAT